MNFGQLLYGLNEGFLQRIKPNFRAIAIGHTNDILFIKVYCDLTPEEDDDEIIRETLSEAESLIEDVKDVRYELIYTEQSLNSLDKLDFWFFLRYDIQ